MADKIRVFGELKEIDTGTLLKLEYGGTVRIIINKSTGKVTFGATENTGAVDIVADDIGADLIQTNQLDIGNKVKLLTASAQLPESESDDVAVYVKGGKLIFAYDDGGTVRYKYLDMTGTGVTWTHTTSAP